MISICMIVKDEAVNLRKCLEQVKKLGYEIIVVDTGSCDNTKEIALQYTDKVFDYKWTNDFSQARNYSISKAKNDYVLILDADEIIIDANKNYIEDIVNKKSTAVGRIHRKNIYNRNGERYIFNEYVNRVFDRRLYMYSGKIHEQIISIDNREYSTFLIPINVSHNGYDTDEIMRKNKIERNIDMLNESIKVDNNDPYLYYQLGKSYYMSGDYNNAYESFEKSLDCNVDTKYEYVEDLIETYGYCLINLKEYDKSLVILNLYDEYKKSADYLFLCGLIYMNNGMFDKAITLFLEGCKIKKCSMEGANNYLAYYNIGVIYECLGQNNIAIKYYSICGNYNKALNRIKMLRKNVDV